jgi:hypothetical protein
VRRRHPKLLKLPPGLVRQVDEMLTSTGEARKTYDEISAWLAEQGHPVSVSAIGRYARWLAAFERVKLVGEQAKVIISEAQSEGGLAIEEATAKVAAVVVMEVLQEAMNGKGGQVDTKRVGKLIGEYAKLQASSVLRERWKAQMAQLRQKAEKAVQNIERKTQLSPDTLSYIREVIYGLAPR